MTEKQLRDPEMLTKPMMWENWFLRVLIVETARVCNQSDLQKWQNARFTGPATRRTNRKAGSAAGLPSGGN